MPPSLRGALQGDDTKHGECGYEGNGGVVTGGGQLLPGHGETDVATTRKAY